MPYVKFPISVGISSAGALIGTVGMLLWFANYYETQIKAETGAEATLASFMLPVSVNIAMVGGIFWAVSAYGFLKDMKWAFSTAIIGSVLCILGGFFPILPYVSTGLGFPPTSTVFAVNLLFFVLLQTHVRPTQRKVLLLSFLTGIAYVLAFINGVASTHYILVTHGSYYIALEPINFFASIAWGVTTVSTVLGKSWSSMLISLAAIASILGGIPIALASQVDLSRPSLFWPSPLLALTIIGILHFIGNPETESKDRLRNANVGNNGISLSGER